MEVQGGHQGDLLLALVGVSAVLTGNLKYKVFMRMIILVKAMEKYFS